MADVTGGRSGVHYEAGFAYGLGLQVLYGCHAKLPAYEFLAKSPISARPKTNKTTWFKQVAFDNNHQNFLLWDDGKDLHEKLKARIEGLGLSLATSPPPAEARFLAPLAPEVARVVREVYPTVGARALE